MKPKRITAADSKKMVETAKKYQHLFQGPIPNYFKAKGMVIHPIEGSETNELPVMGTAIQQVTGDDSTFMLAHLSPKQRADPGPAAIDRMIDDMLNYWETNTGDAIRMDLLGRNIDAQLRLLAIEKRGKVDPNFSLSMMLMFNATVVLDKGRPRTISDFVRESCRDTLGADFPIGRTKENNLTRHVAAVALCVYLWKDGHRVNNGSKRIVNHTLLIDTVKCFPEIVTETLNLITMFNQKDISIGMEEVSSKIEIPYIVSLMVIGQLCAPKKTAAFFNDIFSGNRSQNSAAGSFLRLIKDMRPSYAPKDTRGDKATKKKRFATLVKCFNGFMKNENPKTSRLAYDDDGHEIFPLLVFPYSSAKRKKGKKP